MRGYPEHGWRRAGPEPDAHERLSRGRRSEECRGVRPGDVHRTARPDQVHTAVGKHSLLPLDIHVVAPQGCHRARQRGRRSALAVARHVIRPDGG
ncbi:MAG: hypothetical protein GEU83_01140 [Pseudonocardiaceae bacterium]|nr:hypothetical protein [Pseudonocardiaceae bacterium]